MYVDLIRARTGRQEGQRRTERVRRAIAHTVGFLCDCCAVQGITMRV